MKHERSIFDDLDSDADAAPERRAEADIREGRVISNEAVIRWLKSWGRGKRLPKARRLTREAEEARKKIPINADTRH